MSNLSLLLLMSWIFFRVKLPLYIHFSLRMNVALNNLDNYANISLDVSKRNGDIIKTRDARDSL